MDQSRVTYCVFLGAVKRSKKIQTREIAHLGTPIALILMFGRFYCVLLHPKNAASDPEESFDGKNSQRGAVNGFNCFNQGT